MSYQSYSLDEPCGSTSPSIDGVIANIDAAISTLEDLLESEEPGTAGAAMEALDNLSGLESDLNELRQNNSDLRDWGCDLANIIKQIQEVL